MKHAPLSRPLSRDTLDVLATLLDRPAAQLEQAWADAGASTRSNWQTYRVGPKRRRLHVPNEAIATVQRAILARVLATGTASPAACGGVPGRSFVEAARRHLETGSDLLRLDIADAFDSTSYRVVAAALRRRLRDELWMMGLDGDERAVVAGVVAHLVTVRHVDLDQWVLPAGAPTSTAVFNLVCLDIDRALEAWLAEQGEQQAVYTRYVDDLVVSHVSRETLLRLPDAAATILQHYGYRLNPDKTQQMDGDRAEVYRLRGHRGGVELTPSARESIAERMRGWQQAADDVDRPEHIRRTAIARLRGVEGFLRLVYGDTPPRELAVAIPDRLPAPAAATIDDLWL